MKPLDHLTQEEARKAAILKKARTALATGKITRAEYDYLLRAEQISEPEEREARRNPLLAYATSSTIKERRRATLRRAAATMLFLIITLSILWISAPGGTLTGPTLTGHTIKEVTTTMPTNQTFTTAANITLNTTTLTSLRVSGTLTNGSGTITLHAGNQTLLVWSGSAALPPTRVWLPFESYALNETITANVTPANGSYTLWLSNGKKTPVLNNFTIAEPGRYTLEALINTSNDIVRSTINFTIRNDTNSSNDEKRAPPSTSFTGACNQTCTLNLTNRTLTLQLLPDAGATLTLTNITTGTRATNHAPVATGIVPDVTLAVGETSVLNLSNYFTDPDGDTLIYDYMNVPGATLTVDGSSLTITANEAGTSQSVIYASDLYSLTESNTFTITITPSNTTSNATATNTTTQNTTVTNTTVTNTTNTTVTNTTVTNTTNTTVTNTSNETVNTIDCSNPDPNKRPIACLQEESAKYFPEQEIYIMTTTRKPVARITPIGNLLIKGDAVEGATFTARKSDYRIGYEDDYGNYHTTIWFDSETGNLYLKGRVHEENENNIPAAESFVLRNKRGITLAWANPKTGDLYLRGNLIPYRKEVSR